MTLLPWVEIMNREFWVLWICDDAVQWVQTDLFMFIRLTPEAEAGLVSMNKSSTQGLYRVRLSPSFSLWAQGGAADGGSTFSNRLQFFDWLVRVSCPSVCRQDPAESMRLYTVRTQNIHFWSHDWSDCCLTLHDFGTFGNFLQISDRRGFLIYFFFLFKIKTRQWPTEGNWIFAYEKGRMTRPRDTECFFPY